MGVRADPVRPLALGGRPGLDLLDPAPLRYQPRQVRGLHRPRGLSHQSKLVGKRLFITKCSHNWHYYIQRVRNTQNFTEC